MAYMAVVQAVLPGSHGDFVVTRSQEVVGSITFALDPEVWKERDVPEPGTVVVLDELRRKKAGWRALSARHVRPDDQMQETELSSVAVPQQ